LLHGIYIFDANNTLWDTHRIYIEGYQRLLSFLQRGRSPLHRQLYPCDWFCNRPHHYPGDR